MSEVLTWSPITWPQNQNGYNMCDRSNIYFTQQNI